MPFKQDEWLNSRMRMIQKAKERIDTQPLAGLREQAVDTAIAMGGRFRKDWFRAFADDAEMTRLLTDAFTNEDES